MMLIHTLDTSVLQWLYSIRSLPVTYLFIDISELGTLYSISAGTFALFLFLLLRKMTSFAYALVACMAFAGASVLILKFGLEVPRPDVFYRAYPESGFSFPSGHTTGSAAFYGFMAYVVSTNLKSKYSRPIVAGLLLLIAAISFSRLYLGVHYVSDVLGGLFLGSTAVLLGTRVVQRLELQRMNKKKTAATAIR